MIEITGKYNTAKVYTDVIEETAIEQIKTLCDQEFTQDSVIRIMPDVHAGKGCTIGFTMTITDKVCPNLVGVDIGCGMLTVNIGKHFIVFQKLDDVIRDFIPFGRNVHEGRVARFDLTQLKCYRNLKDTKRLERSIGSLGGGNHFIEVDVDDNGDYYLVIHSGSRNLGHQVATYYQNLAVELCSGRDKMYAEQEDIIRTYKEQGRRSEIQNEIKKLMRRYTNLFPSLPEDLCYLTGKYKDDYLCDMELCQRFAIDNRRMMANIIIKKMGFEEEDGFETIHNYISFDDNILRKGAISARGGESVLIPINMRDGCIIGVGKGNVDWNYSAPHGAGRLMSRNKAKEVLKLNEFQDSMNGIFTTSVGQDTLDEAPMAYKSIDDIINNIGDTVIVQQIIKPVYNFKASE
jgi:RNA-splicing ligase RtcB